jgi:hypothetical protein
MKYIPYIIRFLLACLIVVPLLLIVVFSCGLLFAGILFNDAGESILNMLKDVSSYALIKINELRWLILFVLLFAINEYLLRKSFFRSTKGFTIYGICSAIIILLAIIFLYHINYLFKV